jgi:peptidoglycan/LPS O-acetylase OafA/YrhL
LEGISLLPLFAAAIRYPDWFVFRILNWGWVRFIGVISYSIYLLHPTVLFAIHEWTPWNGLVQGALSLGLTLLFAALIYQYIERPCGRLRKRLSRVVAPS